MHVVVLGNFAPHHSTENHWRRSFEALGHDVCCVQENEIDSIRRLRQRLLCEAPALVLYVRTWGLPQEAIGMWRDLEAEGIVTAAAHLDRYFGLDREHLVRSDPMFRVGHVFTADGDHQPEFEAAGVNHHWLPPGVVADECYDAPPDPEWVGRWDVAFVGSAPTADGGNYHLEWPHRAELVARLREWYGDRFVHVGNGGTLANNADRPNLRGADVNRFYASVPIIVGDSCQVHAGARYWSDRVPETWGRGGFLIHPRVDALQAQLGPYPGDQWEPGDWDYLRDCIDGWRSDRYASDGVRARIAHTVRRDHTYTARAREILRVVGLDCHEEAAHEQLAEAQG